MSFEPNATQAQALLRLLFIAEEPAISKFKPDLPAGKRKGLVDAGLITIEKRGRAQHVMLTDNGWSWAAENLNKLVPPTLNRLHPEILQSILEVIGKNMALRNCSLAEMLRPEIFGVSVETTGGEDVMASETLADSILRISRQLTETCPGTRVRLADLRRALSHVERSTLDSTLIKMQADNDIVLSKLERYEVTTDDEAAAIRIAGLPRYVLYLKQP